MEEENEIRKRVRVLGGDGDIKRVEIPETPDGKKSLRVVIGPERIVHPAIHEKAGSVVLHNNEVDPVIFKSGATGKLKNGLSKSYPSINRLQDSKVSLFITSSQVCETQSKLGAV